MSALNKIIESIKDQSFLKLHLSPPKSNIRKLETKKGLVYQLSETKGAQEFHSNFTEAKLIEWLKKTDFKQGQLFCTDANYHLFFPEKVIKSAPTEKRVIPSHNRVKNHVLSLQSPPPYFEALKIQRDKFLQIEKFLTEVKAILPHLKERKKLNVVDFGCGKAYLTFALYDFLLQQDFDVTLVGIDLKPQVMKDCQELSDRLGYTGLKFIQGHIDELPWQQADLVVALHACDTATDAALEKGVSLKAKVLLAAPCCQHELLGQVENSTLLPLLKHGILKERFSALVTDAARGVLLEMAGYEVRLVEFIDAAHTPKNILIRAIFTGHKSSLESYEKFKASLNILPNLEKRLFPKL